MSPLEAINPAPWLWRSPQLTTPTANGSARTNSAAERSEAGAPRTGPSARAVAYFGYCFALDREQQAAIRLERLLAARATA